MHAYDVASENSTGECKGQNIQPRENGEKVKVQVKVEVSCNGVVSVTSATAVVRVSADVTVEINREMYNNDGFDLDAQVGTMWLLAFNCTNKR